jgi:hypothetical protein
MSRAGGDAILEKVRGGFEKFAGERRMFGGEGVRCVRLVSAGSDFVLAMQKEVKEVRPLLDICNERYEKGVRC